jgi:bifunctional N-acetylglucosamine-1-phosphate-uridyltransferase/glucosamine-1-phosphate-acetyltransferase GlmU-like protein
MAGTGQRFVDRGYIEPKPLIKVNEKRIIEYILDMFSEDDEFVFICNNDHTDNTNMGEILYEIRPNVKVWFMPQHKLGPVHTVKTVYDEIDDDEEVIISYCDNPYLWDRDDFINHIRENELDGCILTHTGFHPHTLANTKMAFIKEKDGLLEEIKEKECYTDNPMNEHASTGIYYFRKGSYVKKYFEEMIERDINYNGEYYVTLVYNLLVEDGLRVGYYDTPYVTVFGTPDEVENFEAWATILKGSQVKNEEDLLKCYNYWKEYHESELQGRKSKVLSRG